MDADISYARRHGLFWENEMVCSTTLYNAVCAVSLPPKSINLPEALKRKRHKHKRRQNERLLRISIEKRPVITEKCIEEEHWEGNTIVGQRAGKEAVILTYAIVIYSIKENGG